MPETIPKITASVFLLVAGLIFGIAVSLVILLVVPGNANEITSSRIALFAGELLMPIPIILWARKVGNRYVSIFRLQPVSKRSLYAAIPLGVGLTIIIDELDRIAQMIHPVPENFIRIQEMMAIKDAKSVFFVIGVVIILAPFIEELIFRGFFQRVLEYRLKNVTKAVLFSALTFAIVHFNPWWAIQIYLIGLFLGYVAWRTGSIWVSFLLHAMNNGIAVWFANLSPESISWYEWNGHTAPWIIILGIALFYTGIKTFIKVTPVSEKIEDASDSPTISKLRE